MAHNAALLIQNIVEKENINAEMMLKNQAVQISIEHVTIFLSIYISKGAVDMKFSLDVGNNPSNPHILIKQI